MLPKIAQMLHYKVTILKVFSNKLEEITLSQQTNNTTGVSYSFDAQWDKHGVGMNSLIGGGGAIGQQTKKIIGYGVKVDNVCCVKIQKEETKFQDNTNVIKTGWISKSHGRCNCSRYSNKISGTRNSH